MKECSGGASVGVCLSVFSELSWSQRARQGVSSRRGVHKSIYYKVRTVFVWSHRASRARPPGFTEG